MSYNTDMTNILLDRYRQQTLPHAVLLVTQPATAIALVNELIQELQLNVADYLLLHEPTTIKIAEARNIRQFTELTRFTSPIKLVSIANATQLTPEAANALLKTLEEPPSHTHFVLAADRPDSILPTVRSRCQVITLTSTEQSAESLVPPLKKTNLFGAFDLAKELAAGDTPLPTLFRSWQATTTNMAWHEIILRYLPLAETTVNRRLLLDNFFLEIYNSD